jgi:hypothetical protein
MNYDKLYGVSIDEYCKYHQITIDDLINKTEKDIELLKKNLNKEIYTEPTNWELVGSIHSLLLKKEKHLKRLKQWKKGVENESN